MTPRQFAAIAPSKTPPGVLGVVALPCDCCSARLPADPGPRVLLLEDIQDPGNVGALVRTAAAFGFSGIILSDKCADPFSPKAVQASAGTLLSIWVRRTSYWVRTVSALARKGYHVVVADTNGGVTPEQVPGHKLVLALGSEGRGPSDKVMRLAGSVVTIPYNASRAESLNVAVAGAICMYAVTRGVSN